MQSGSDLSANQAPVPAMRQPMPAVVSGKRSSRRATLPNLPGVILLCGLAVMASGCEGCRPDFLKRSERDPTAETPEKVKPFESKDLKVLPTDETLALQGVKPGHWFSVQHQMKSNKADFYGVLDCVSSDKSGRPLPLRQLDFELQTKRLISLPKGQSKTVELTFFAPPVSSGTNQIWLSSDLRPSFGGPPQDSQRQLATRMAPHQSFLVVLARRPDSYGFLKTLPTVRPPLPTILTSGFVSDYLVVLPHAERGVPLPSWPLMWTMVSHVVWDDFDAGTLTPSQQRALLDWLHWGGQLVISGPSSLDSLQSSFLAQYLPAKSQVTRKLTSQDVAPINRVWGRPSRRSSVRAELTLNPDTAPEIVELGLTDGGTFVADTGNLVAERRVGRGRIVATAFALNSRTLKTWTRFDNFFNGCILRRPARVFDYTDVDGLHVRWSEGIRESLNQRRREADEPENLVADQVPQFRAQLPDATPRRFPVESLLTSKLRFFSRDAADTQSVFFHDRDDALDVSGYSYDSSAGVAGWNDFSRCSSLARNVLTEAAGITVPDRDFILLTLGLYLLVLVPANWIVFRAMGRVEWAWLAVPVISVVGTYFVVRLAQLDIGFARSRTEIAVLETQPDYKRAHLTRYTGLYTSLSTVYSLSYASDSALALPFPSTRLRRMGGQATTRVNLERVDKRDERVCLDGFAVASNSTEMLHSEEITDLGGPIRMTESEAGLVHVYNDSTMNFRDVGIVRRRGDQIEAAWIGLLSAGSSLPIRFQSVPNESPLFAGWSDLSAASDAGFQLQDFLNLAVSPGRLRDGDVRLAGWSDAEVQGVTIRPAARQQVFRTLLVSNLRYGNYGRPQSDQVTADDVSDLVEMTDEDELQQDRDVEQDPDEGQR